jgi:hypothetical protein
MNKNCIEGRHGGRSRHNTAKSRGSTVEVNAAVVSRSNALLPGEIPWPQGDGKSAEVILAGSEPGGIKAPQHKTPEDSMP